MAELAKHKGESEIATPEHIRGTTYTPRFDILETENELLLYGDLPGVSPSDLDVQFENRELTIQGRVAARHEGVDYLYSEYGIGDFYRAFTIGESIDSARIAAELKNGVLILHLPKTEAVKPKKIDVKVA